MASHPTVSVITPALVGTLGKACSIQTEHAFAEGGC